MTLNLPIFLLCSERSGSNLITRMMNAHPEVCGPSPTHLLRIFGWNLARYAELQDDGNWQLFLKDFQDIFEAQLGVWQTCWNGNDLKKLPPQLRGLSPTYGDVYGREAEHAGKSRCFIKENQCYSLMPYIQAHWPDASFVFLVRDPRDMALSWKKTPAIPGGVEKAAAVWQRDQCETLRVFQSLYHLGKMELVHYEDLVGSPEKTLTRICNRTGVDYSESMIDFYRGQDVQTNSERIDAWTNTARPLIADNTRKYGQALSEAEIRYIETVCRKEMTILGYVPDYPDDQGREELYERVSRISRAEAVTQNELGQEEKAIRARRQEIIDRILARDFLHALEIEKPGAL